jgi:hypothetical protein
MVTKLIAVLMLAASVTTAAAADKEFNVGDTLVFRGPLRQIACSLIKDTYDGWLKSLHEDVGAGIPLSDSRSYIYVRTIAFQRWVDAVNRLQQQGRFCTLTEMNVDYLVVAKKFSQGTFGPPSDTPVPAGWSSSSSFYLCLKPKTAESNTCLWTQTGRPW